MTDRDLRPASDNLPPRPTPFVNRESEIEFVITTLTAERMRAVALVGAEGIGKTWLALEVAHRLDETKSFSGGVVWIALKDLTTLDALVFDEERPQLIILDGIDRIGIAAPLLGRLPPGAKMLLTGRRKSALPNGVVILHLSGFNERAARTLILTLAKKRAVEIPASDYRILDEIAAALEYRPDALALAGRLVQSGKYAALLGNLASIYRERGREAESLKLYYAALTLARKVGDHQVAATALYHLGASLVEHGHRRDGLGLLEESLAIRRRQDDLKARADTIYQVARAHHLLGDLQEARVHYRDALRLYESIDYRQGVAACQAGLGWLMLQIGAPDEALRELDAAGEIFRRIGGDQYEEAEAALQMAHYFKEKWNERGRAYLG